MLLRMLYEVDGDTAAAAHLLEMPSLWRYRARVTLEHLKREMDEQYDSKQKKSPYPVLDLFLREVVELQLICCCKKFYSWQIVTTLYQLNEIFDTETYGGV